MHLKNVSCACFTILSSVLNLSELQIEMRVLDLEQNGVGYDSKGGFMGPSFSLYARPEKKILPRIMKGHENGHEIDSSASSQQYHTLFPCPLTSAQYRLN